MGTTPERFHGTAVPAVDILSREQDDGSLITETAEYLDGLAGSPEQLASALKELDEAPAKEYLAGLLETNPEQVMPTLKELGVFEYEVFEETGLYAASPGLDEEAKKLIDPEGAQDTKMDKAWLRDNAHIALFRLHNQLLDPQEAKGQFFNVSRSFFNIFKKNEDLLADDKLRQLAPGKREGRLPIRVEGDTLDTVQEDIEKPRVQNDSIGYGLLITSEALLQNDFEEEASEGQLSDRDVIERLVKYFKAIEFWHDPDDGQWEEDPAIRTSSIGVVTASLIKAKKAMERHNFGDTEQVDHLIEKGRQALRERLPWEILPDKVQWLPDATAEVADEHAPWQDSEARPDYIPSYSPGNPLNQQQQLDNETERGNRNISAIAGNISGGGRLHDAAHLFLAWPLDVLDVLDEDSARQFIEDIREDLLGEYGMARYQNDTYWAALFNERVHGSSMTTKNEESQKARDQYGVATGYTETEAQWPMFDGFNSMIFRQWYKGSHAEKDKAIQLFHAKRIIYHLSKRKDGTFKMPEAYFLQDVTPEDDATQTRWGPNGHTPLQWAQAVLEGTISAWYETLRDDKMEAA